MNRFKENGSMDRRPGSERPQTPTTAENGEIVEDLICSQEESPGVICHQEKSKKTWVSILGL